MGCSSLNSMLHISKYAVYHECIMLYIQKNNFYIFICLKQEKNNNFLLNSRQRIKETMNKNIVNMIYWLYTEKEKYACSVSECICMYICKTSFTYANL